MTATAIREAPPASARALHDLREIPLDQLQPHPKNRKKFDQAKIEELAVTLKADGQVTPAVVRLSQANGRADRFEIIAGDRRWRAAKIAGLPTLLCVVRQLSDLQALTLLAVENNHRADLHPMEEAELFEAFTKIDSLSQPRIAELVSRKPDYIRDRLQLLKLIKPARKLFLEDRFTVKHAILLARLSPNDQERAIGDDSGSGVGRHLTGLFTEDFALFDGPDTQEGTDSRKAVSVGEFQKWIDDHVRFNVADQLVPELFPETAAALEEAQAVDEKVVHITYDHMPAADAKDSKVRTIGNAHWERADGEPIAAHGYSPNAGKKSKTCEHSVLGIVAAGPDRGQAFRVCIEKKKCAVHWGAEIRERAKREKQASTGNSGAAARDREAERARKVQEEQARERAESERWKKAIPQLTSALAEKIKQSAAGSKGLLGQLLIRRYGRCHDIKVDFPVGTSAEDLVRFLGFVQVLESINPHWRLAESAIAALKPFGLDARAIVDGVAPKPAPVKKAEAKPAKKKAKR